MPPLHVNVICLITGIGKNAKSGYPFLAPNRISKVDWDFVLLEKETEIMFYCV